MKVAVVGSGSWGTAIVKMLLANKTPIVWNVRNEETKKYISQHKHNPKYLQSAHLNTRYLEVVTDINETFSKASLIIIALPSIHVESVLQELTIDFSDKKVVSATKGVIPKLNKVISDFYVSEYKMKLENYAVISGPCHSEEVAMEKLSYLTISSQSLEMASLVGGLLASKFIKVTLSSDVVGCEYATMLKNIYSIASGIANGLGYGDNFQSILMSNAIREMEAFVSKMEHMEREITASAYLGDLLVTAYSTYSRNRNFGTMIGKGYTSKNAQLEMNMVVEGYFASQAAHNLSRRKKLKTPILKAVYEILYKGKSPKKAFKRMSKKLD